MKIFFQISAQYGDPKAPDIFFPIQLRLNQAFGREMDQTLIGTLDKLSVVLRVSGATWDFKNSGPERLKYRKKDREITIDLAVPEKQWNGVPIEEVKSWLKSRLEACVHQILEKAESEKCKVDRPKVEEVFASKFDAVFGCGVTNCDKLK